MALMNIPSSLESAPFAPYTEAGCEQISNNTKAWRVPSDTSAATQSFYSRHVFGGAPLMEFHDRQWFPPILRDYVTDGLQFILNLARVYGPIVPRLKKAIHAARPEALVDLCSGGGGPWPWLHRLLQSASGPVTVCLTDKYPNTLAFESLRRQTQRQVTFYRDAVNAVKPPPELLGFRTIFTSFHHFQPQQALAILQNVVDARQGIGVFEATQRRPLSLLLTLLMFFGGFLTAPFIRPFRFSRLCWTYLIPVIPFVLFFDGVVSCLRAYSKDELAELVLKLDADDYVWEIGEESGGLAPITYLVGYPGTRI